MPRKKSTPRTRELEREIADMEALAVKSESKNSFTAAVAARSRLTTMRRDLARLRAEVDAQDEPDALRRIQRLQRQAAEEGSWTSAADLLRQEQELLTQRAAEAKLRAEEDAKAKRDAQALKMDAVEHLRALPIQLRREILGLTGDE